MKKLLREIRDNNIFLDVVDGNLSVFTNGSQPDPALIAEIKARKEELVRFLQTNNTGSTNGLQANHIPVVPDQENYVLSSAQRRIWILSQFEQSNSAYNIPQAYVFEGDVQADSLQYALVKVMERHEIMRTRFKEDAQGNVKQFVVQAEGYTFNMTRLDMRDTNNQQTVLAQVLHKEVSQTFDLAAGPLVRAALIQTGDSTWIFSYVMHHIISDAWSMRILLKELLLFYNARIKGEQGELPPAAIQYRDYACWQQQQLQEAVLQQQKQYWLKQLQGPLPVLNLPTDFLRPAVKTYHGGVVLKTIDQALVSRLSDICQAKNATIFMGLLAVVYTLLHRYTGQEDIIIGAPVAGREHTDLEDQIGVYLNTLALRTTCNEADSFNTLLEKIKHTTLEAYANQLYPFNELVADLNLQRDVSRGALFDVLIDFHDTREALKKEYFTGFAVQEYKNNEQVVSKFDLTFMFIYTDEGLCLSLEYNSDLYTRGSVERMQEHFEGLLRQVMTNTLAPVDELPFISPHEHDTLLHAFNTIASNYEQYASPVFLFEEQVAKTPQAIAVCNNETTLSYKTIQEKSNQLANYLRDHCQIGANDLVGIMLDRSEWMIVAMLGILKAGGAYVPIMPDYPAARKQYIFRDTGIRVLLTQTDFIFELNEYSGEVFAMDIQLDVIETSPEPPAITLQPGHLAYVLFTSGSTGQPKGCAITHGNLSNYIQWANNYYFKTTGAASFGLYTSLSFDLTVTSIFCSLTTGGRLWIYGGRQEMADILLHQFGEESGINAIKITPSHIRILKHLSLRSSTVGCAIVGGEEVTPEQVRILKAINPAIRIYNEYGPTEATVGCMIKELEENAPVLIGKPIAHTQILMLDKKNSLCPIGIPGEICIAGAGLAKEYFNNAALTAEKFINHPFKKGERIYKTGDLGKWLSEGDVQFLGRMDDQVKIRGHRIELSEVEGALHSLTGIDNAVVAVIKDREGEKELVAYYTGKGPLDALQLRNNLSTLLPGYMVPGHFMRLTEIPVTINGKTDKSRLPNPAGWEMPAGIEYAPPRNETEEKLAAILQEVLGKGKIGIKDNFFASGGDSIKAITFIVTAKRQLGIEISVDALYEHATLEELCDWLISDKGVISQDKVYRYLETGREQIAVVRAQIEADNVSVNRLPENYEAIYPVVPIEQGMIYSSMFNPEEPVYYDQFSYLVHIPDLDQFKKALDRLVQRHPILRTEYYMGSFSRPVKVVRPEIVVPFTFEDISALPKDEQLRCINAYIERDLNKRLVFDGELLWRLNMFRLKGDEYHITYSFHHALLDGWSVSIFKTELWNFDEQSCLALPHNYQDYCAITLGKGQSKEIAEYWQRLMKGYTRNKLPFNYKGQRISNEKGMRRVSRYIDDDLLEKLNQVSLHHQISFKAICLAAHIYLMHIICSEKDVVTGVVTHDRPGIEDSEKILGCFLNTVPVRMEIDQLINLLSLLQEVNRYLIHVKPNEIHLSDIARTIDDKTSSANPVFDTILNYTDFHSYENLNETGLYADPAASNMEVAHEMTNTLFDVEVDKTLKRFSIKIKYKTAWFREADVQYAIDLYVRILQQVAEDVYAPLATLNTLSVSELQETLVDFNATELPYAKHKTIHQLLEEQADKTPDAIALTQDGIHLSYRDLNERANRLAAYLVAEGVRTGDNIGLLVARSFDMIIGMYAILKAGAAYVPIDTDYPASRQEYIAANSCVVKILTDAQYPLAQIVTEIPFLFMPHAPADRFSGANLQIPVNSIQLAYTIYTSGSTGRPKGVMIEHHSVVNLIEWVNTTFQVGPGHRLLFITSMCFDLSVYDIFGMLACGGTIVIARQEEVQHPQQLKSLLINERITFWDSVPTTMNYLVGELESENDGFVQHDLRIVFLSGDWIPVQLPERIKKYFPEARVISLGGATEGTVWSNYFPVTTVDPLWNSIPYGRPIKNNCFYILDDHLRPVPKGVAGELYIGGVGVARGYANDTGKTTYSFKKDPFNNRLGGRMYKTGDIGRLLPDGNLEFIGRKDNQVKIRGYRVELGEIESVLQKHNDIRDAIVDIYKDATGNNRLCAYLVLHQPVDIRHTKEYLKSRLPAYMVPDQFMILEALPLNSNGKINRKALPRATVQEGPHQENLHQAPVTATQEVVEKIWKNILHLERIGLQDDFFDLGANSLSVGAFVNRVHRETGKVISIRDVFTTPTIEGLAALLANRHRSAFAFIQPAAHQNAYPLSAPQQQLWVLNQIEEGNASYHIPGMYVFEGNLNRAALDYAFSQLIERHDILRTVFREDEQGAVKQYILTKNEINFSITYKELLREVAPGLTAARLVENEFLQPFDLSAGPLIRAALFKLADNKWVFSYTLHHIVSDGWSTGIVIHELLTFYSAHVQNIPNPLQPLRIQYKDYAVWQQQQLKEGVLNDQRNYWLQQFQGNLPVLDLPGDKMRPPVKTFHGGTVVKLLNRQVTSELKLFSREQGGTLFMGILTSVYALLHRYTGQEDIIIGSPVAGRGHTDLENQIGFYVNTLAFRTRFAADDGFKELFEKVKQVTLGAFANQLYPFDEIVYDLQLQRDISRGTLFDVMVILQNNETNYSQASERLPDLKISGYEAGDKMNSKFDLVFDVVETGDELQVSIEYNSDIFYRETMLQLGDHLEQLLAALLSDPGVPVKQADYLTASEKQQLLVSFNDTAVDYPHTRTVGELFYDQVILTPQQIALIYEDVQLTYDALNRLSNRFNNYLRLNYSIAPDDIIGVILPRSEWLVVAIAAIVKSGSACLPIDPASPAERTAYIIQNSQCKVVIGQQELEHFLDVQNEYSDQNTIPGSGPQHLAYIIYTSGSTGHPKGCMLENRGVMNHLFSKINSLQLQAGQVLCHNSEMHFVGGIWQLWAPLVTGGTMVLCNQDELKDFGQVLYKANEFRSTVLEVIPSQLNEYLTYEKEIPLGSIRTLILTGEKLTPHFVNRCYAGNEQVNIINTYGQTEFSDVTACYTIPAESEQNTILIGSPIQNTRIYILSPAGALCPIGVPGEICTSGDGIARGYINQADLTNEKFIEDPFNKGCKMYKTGDLARWLPNGRLEILGRKDEQFKIRGFRIETGEIENALLQHAAIDEAIVLYSEQEGSLKSLDAYIVSKHDLNITEIRNHLAQKVPHYMLPHRFIRFDAFPLLPNGKIDKRGLSNAGGKELHAGNGYKAPKNDTERSLTVIWEEILQRERVGVTDNFFELGGHSLKATTMANKIKQTFKVHITLKQIFQTPSIQNIAEEIQKKLWIQESIDSTLKTGDAREVIRI